MTGEIACKESQGREQSKLLDQIEEWTGVPNTGRVFAKGKQRELKVVYVK